jgi:4-amino-4-deoxy-L-arabinose transferase-like glycosyltransferase
MTPAVQKRASIQQRNQGQISLRSGILVHPAVLLALIVLVGVALRLWMIWVSPLDPRFSNADDGDYYRRALRLAVTGQYIDDAWLIRPPLHVFFFALWLRLALLAGVPQLGVLFVQLAQTVVAALTILVGYACANRLFSSVRAGLLFAGFLSLWYSFVEQPTVLFSELIYQALFLTHLWLLLRFDASGRRRDLLLSGIALGAAALTRSPALYSLAFVGVWLLLRRPKTQDPRPKNQEPISDADGGPPAMQTADHQLPATSRRPPSIVQHLSSIAAQLALITLGCLAIVLPWTARNYVVYQRLIPVDTLGQINLWLDLDRVEDRNPNIETLRGMPQADRAGYALARAREILAANPLKPFEPMWSTFQHIWKAQFVEDYFIKQSFFTRPLRETAWLGLVGDLIWLVFTLAGLIGLVGPVREGWHNRLFMLAWLGYSFVTVLIFHVEPRYLLPIWTLIGLYGAGSLARIGRRRTAEPQNHGTAEPRTKNQELMIDGGQRAAAIQTTDYQPQATSHQPPLTVFRPLSLLQLLVALVFLALFLSYRDYPRILAAGFTRERAAAAADRAYHAGDYVEAERGYRAALAAQPNFVDAQVGLALALGAQGRRDEAISVLQRGSSRRAELTYGALAREAGDRETASSTLIRYESIAGEDVQAWALEWLRPPPTSQVMLGNGLDLGYIEGFSESEQGATGSFRWLAGSGRVVMPLPEPLPPGARLILRLTGGRQGATPLTVRIGDGPAQTVQVQGGQWRSYHLAIPAELAGATRLTVTLQAPTFVPAMENPQSNDARALSLMVGEVRVQ